MPKQFGQQKQLQTDPTKAKVPADAGYGRVSDGPLPPTIRSGQDFGGGPAFDSGGGGKFVPGLEPKTLPDATPMPPEMTPEKKKKKLDWQAILSGGLDAFESADQEDPLSMLAMMNAGNDSMKGQIY